MQNFTFSVTDTNLVALKSKKSAVELGYMRDVFISYFVPSSIKKEVVLNKGYWCRHFCIHSILKHFIKNSKEPVQIISIGCGLDTTPFMLFKEFSAMNCSNFKIIETDLESVVHEKVKVINGHTEFKKYVENDLGSKISQTEITGSRYSLFPLDLNDFGTVFETMNAHKVDFK